MTKAATKVAGLAKAKSRLAGALRKLELALARDPAGLGERTRAFTVNFHDYSPMNRLLIMSQRPNATYLKGRKQWAAAGRTVKPRARSVRILAPAAAPGTATKRVTFTEVKIYDVADTTGAPFDVSAIATVPVDEPALVASRLRQLELWVRGAGLRLVYRAYPAVNRVIDGATDGATIWVRPDLPPGARLAVLAHEIAHVKMHFPRKQRGADLVLDCPNRPSREKRELQAELTSYFLLDLLRLIQERGHRRLRVPLPRRADRPDGAGRSRAADLLGPSGHRAVPGDGPGSSAPLEAVLVRATSSC